MNALNYKVATVPKQRSMNTRLWTTWR